MRSSLDIKYTLLDIQAQHIRLMQLQPIPFNIKGLSTAANTCVCDSCAAFSAGSCDAVDAAGLVGLAS